MPHGILIGALVREGQVIIPEGGTVIKASDRTIVFATRKVVKQAEAYFIETKNQFAS